MLTMSAYSMLNYHRETWMTHLLLLVILHFITIGSAVYHPDYGLYLEIINPLGYPHHKGDIVNIHCFIDIYPGYEINLTKLVLKYNGTETGCQFVSGRMSSVPINETEVVHNGFTIKVPSPEQCETIANHSQHALRFFNFSVEVTEVAISEYFQCESYDSTKNRSMDSVPLDRVGTPRNNRVIESIERSEFPPSEIKMRTNPLQAAVGQQFHIFCSYKNASADFRPNFQFEFLRSNQSREVLKEREDIGYGLFIPQRESRDGFNVSCFDLRYQQDILTKEFIPHYVEPRGKTRIELELCLHGDIDLNCTDYLLSRPNPPKVYWKVGRRNVLQHHRLKMTAEDLFNLTNNGKEMLSCLASVGRMDSGAVPAEALIQFEITWLICSQHKVIGQIRRSLEQPTSDEDMIEVECRASGFANMTGIVVRYLDTDVGCKYNSSSSEWVTTQAEEEVVIHPGITIQAPTQQLCSTMNHTKVSVLVVRAMVSNRTVLHEFECLGYNSRPLLLLERIQGWFPDNNNANSTRYVEGKTQRRGPQTASEILLGERPTTIQKRSNVTTVQLLLTNQTIAEKSDAGTINQILKNPLIANLTELFNATSKASVITCQLLPSTLLLYALF